jgi:GMP synthase (glutamine-hydrolysing)
MTERETGTSPGFNFEKFPPRVAILDAGAQYVDMIKKASERQGFPTVILPIETDFTDLEKFETVIVSGGPRSSHSEGAPMPDLELWQSSMPTLNICYGMQALAMATGGNVSTRDYRQDGRRTTTLDPSFPLFEGVRKETTALFTHGDFVNSVASDVKVIGEHQKDSERVISAIAKGTHVGVQFHPEVFDDTPQGHEIFSNFFANIAKIEPDQDYIEQRLASQIEQKHKAIQKRVGDKHVIAFVSGGVDSTVAVALASGTTPPERLHMYYIDSGYMRDEDDQVIEMLLGAGFDVQKIDAEEQFEQATAKVDGQKVGPLIDVVNPIHKRRIIGNTFVDIQDDIVASLGFEQDQVVLLQGTNAADRIESGHSKGGEATEQIKEHHNQVQRVRDLNPLEPLDDLFKDEIRQLAVVLGLPEEIAYRQPFPGPGTAIRILGMDEDGFEKRDTSSREKVGKVIEKLNQQKGTELKPKLLPVRSVGVGGDSRSHIAALALEGKANSQDLASISYELTANFRDLANRVVYKLGGGPLDTITPIETKPDKETRRTLRQADKIVFDTMRKMDQLRKIEQFPVVLLPLGSNGKRSIVLRPIDTKTHMTVQAMLPDTHLPHEFFDTVTEQILSKVDGISHVFLDLTNKPPGTTEWE